MGEKRAPNELEKSGTNKWVDVNQDWSRRER